MSFTIPATVQDALHQHLTIESEYRLRYERRLDRDFNETTRDNRSDAFQRFRVGARYKDKGPWSGFAQYQYAHGEGWTSTKNGSDESSDLLQLYAQRQTKSDKITIGRQKINLGTERLIGSLEWVNRSRSFDTVRFQTALWDVFVGRIAVQNTQPQKLHIGAVSYASKIGASSLIHKQQSTTAGNVNIITLDHSMKQNAGTVELDFEAAVQFGRNLGKDQEAWALHLGATKKLSANAKLMAEWNSASGGGSATKSKTFDNLYPTNHKFYGLMDMHAWKNMNQLALTWSTKPRKDLEIKTRVSKNYLMDSKDAWYGAGGGANTLAGGVFKDASGAAGKDLGMEWDLEATWVRTPKQTISAGIGLYQPGSFVKTLTGKNQAQFFGYVQYAAKF